MGKASGKLGITATGLDVRAEAEVLVEADVPAEPETPLEPKDDAVDFGSMKVGELQAYAEEHAIDLGDATKKADILLAIEAHGSVEESA